MIGKGISKRYLFNLSWFFISITFLVNPYYSRAQTCTSIDYNLSTIAAGDEQTIGLREDGTVVAVGRNEFGQLNVSSWTNIKAIGSGAYRTIGLKEDGTIVAIGHGGYLNFTDWTNIKALSVITGRTVGIKEDGTVVVEGYSAFLGNPNWTNIKAIAAGNFHYVGLNEDGTVVAMGINWWGDSHLKVSSWTNIKAIAAGYFHTVGLREDGTVVAVGRNNRGQLNVSNWTNIKAIAARNDYTIGIKEDGSVVAVGWINGSSDLNVSGWTNIKAIAPGNYHIVGLKEDGTVVAVGDPFYGKLDVSGWTNIRQPTCLDPTISTPLSLIATDAPCDNGGSISLTWNLSPDDPSDGTGSNKVTGYNVYRSETSGGPYSLIGSIAAGVSNFTDNSAANWITYYYTVKATDGTKESVDSNVASAASFRNLPLPPTNLIASDTPYDLGGSITLSWAKSADDGGGLNNVVSYNISKYSSTNGNITNFSPLPAGTSGYVDSATSDNETYFYYVKAYDGICSNGSDASNVVEGRSINNFTALPGFIRTLPGISPKLLNSLTSKIENAIASFESGNTTVAVNKLNALLNEISAQSGKGIDASTAQTLASYVQNLIAYINAH